MEIKNIFFDFNGTLLDDVDLSFNIEDELFKSLGVEGVTKEFYLDNFCFPVKDYYAKTNFPMERYSEEVGFFFDQYMKRKSTEAWLYPDVKYTLEELKKRGFKLYILSATEKKLLEEQLKELGIHMFFDGYAASDNLHAVGKIEYGNEFINENKIDRSKSIMIGDTSHDYEVAMALGLHCVLFTKGHNSRKVLMKHNVPLIDNLSEILKIVE